MIIFTDIYKYLTMKKQILLLSIFVAFAFVGCLDNPADLAARRALRIDAIETLADYEVPVQPNRTTIVMLDADTLAVTQQQMRISVPRRAVENGELQVSYSQDPIYDNFASSRYWQYLAFEDTRNGDYDYNDLVIHCRIITKYNWRNDSYRHFVDVQPVALGSSLPLRLGILYRGGSGDEHLSEKILCENVRRELFLGNPIFPINTDPTKEIKQVSDQLTTLFEIENFEKEFKLVWFIENGTDRLYAATTNFGADKTYDMISPQGLPYGISFTAKWNYPIEKCHIRNGYPGFDEWIHWGDETKLLKGRQKEFVFPAIADGSGNVDLWNYAK